MIVSDNLRDLPVDRLPPGLGVASAAQFALDTVSVSPQAALRALATLSSRYQNPPRSKPVLLDTLASRYGMGEAVGLMRESIAGDEAGPAPVARRMRADG